VQHTGGLFKRGGSYFIAETRNNNAARLVSFLYSSEHSHICEFGELPKEEQTETKKGYIRFYTKYGYVSKYGVSDILELYTPFTLSTINSMRYYQQGDSMYFVTADGIYVLERNSDIGDTEKEAFSFSEKSVEFTVPPLTFMNSDPIALKPSEDGVNGADITIIAVDPDDNAAKPNAKYAPLFFLSDIGNHVALTYVALSNGLEDNIIYYLKIKTVAEDTGGFKKLTCVIDTSLSPKSSDNSYKLPNTDAIKSWRVSAFTKDRGMPTAAAIYEGRQFLANNKPSYPLGIWGSSTFYEDWFNFTVGSDDGDAIQVKASTESADEILWLVSQSKLFAGTRGGIYIAGSATYNDEALTPHNPRVRLFESVGASPLQPITALDAIFFVDTSGKNVHEIVLSETGAFQAHDLSLLSNDLTQSGIVAHTWQQTPTKTYWCATTEGHLCALTYLKNNNIIAWTKHVIAGNNVRILSLATVHEERNDIVWMVVQRDINGQIKRFIEYIHPMYDPLGQEEFKQFYVDSGVIKEQKYTIQNITRSKNTHVVCDMTPLKRVVGFIGYANEYLVCFKINSGKNDLLEKRDIFLARNITNEGVDIYHDTRFVNKDIPFKKIDPLNYSDYKLDASSNVDMFYKVANITSFGYDNASGETFIRCDNSQLENNDVILIQNSGIKKTNHALIDFPTAGETFRIIKIAGGFYLRTSSNGKIVTQAGKLSNNAEVYKRINRITNYDIGTNCVIELQKELDLRQLNSVVGNLTDIVFRVTSANNDIFIAVSTAGVAYRSTDQGVTWTKSTTIDMGVLNSVCHGQDNTRDVVFVAVGKNGRVCRSVVYGVTWTTSTIEGAGNLTAVCCKDTISAAEVIFIAVSDAGAAYRSTDMGVTWIQSTTTNMGVLNSVCYGIGSDSRFMAVGNAGRIATSADGDTWNISTIPGAETSNLNDLHHSSYLANSRFFVVSNQGKMYYTYNNGDTWQERTVSEGTNLTSITMPGMGDEIFTVSSAGVAYRSTDIGVTWTRSTTTNMGVLNAIVYFQRERILIAVGNNGVIWRNLNNRDNWELVNNKAIDNVYINKVVGMTEINKLRYRIRDISSNGKQLVLYDYKRSPSIPQNNLAVIDSANYSEYDTLIENNGNCYLYFNEVGGLDHLKEQKVSICADGNNAQPKTVTNIGTVNNPVWGVKLDNPAMYCCVGLEEKAYFKTVPFSGGSVLGSSDGIVGSQKDIAIYFYHSLGGRYGAEARETFIIPNKKTNTTKFDSPQNLFTGLVKVPMPNALDIYSRTIYIEHSEPLAFNVLSIAQEVQVTDA
jgi:photosystem II stability/assembly factor-like uncharacterized protein